jgi:hypothetical protein
LIVTQGIDDEIKLEDYTADPAEDVPVVSRRGRRRRERVPAGKRWVMFFLDWWERVAAADPEGRATAHVAIVCLFRWKVSGGQPFTLGNEILCKFRVTRWAKLRALELLRQAGLIEYALRGRGAAPFITNVDATGIESALVEQVVDPAIADYQEEPGSAELLDFAAAAALFAGDAADDVATSSPSPSPSSSSESEQQSKEPLMSSSLQSSPPTPPAPPPAPPGPPKRSRRAKPKSKKRELQAKPKRAKRVEDSTSVPDQKRTRADATIITSAPSTESGNGADQIVRPATNGSDQHAVEQSPKDSSTPRVPVPLRLTLLGAYRGNTCAYCGHGSAQGFVRVYECSGGAVGHVDLHDHCCAPFQMGFQARQAAGRNAVKPSEVVAPTRLH